MKAKHTQGEWITKSLPFLHVESGEQWICQLSDIKMKDGIGILSDEWQQENERTSAEKVANAKLIAAAPELLEALQRTFKRLEALRNECLQEDSQEREIIIDIETDILDKIRKATN